MTIRTARMAFLSRLRSAAAILALVLIWALFFWRFAAPNPADRLTYERGDFSETFGVFRDLSFRALTAGRLPLWAECLWSGYPLHADPQAQVFYPPRWLTSALLWAQGYGHFPLEALVAETALHYLATSLFFYWFLRSRRVSPAAGILGAVTFTYGGYLTGYPPLQTAVLDVATWLPLALLFASRLAETHSPRYLALAAVALALAFLAGHPQTFLFVSVVSLAYFIFCFFNPSPTTKAAPGRLGALLIRLAALGSGLILLTSGLVAVQLVPSLQFIASSTRASVPFEQAAHGFPFQDLLSLLIPNFVSYWNPLYAGLVPLGLALFAVRKNQAEVRFWAALGLAALVISFGTNAVAYDAAYWLLPGLSLFRGAERLALMVSVALATLAAFGAHDLLGSLSRTDRAALRGLGRLTAFLFFVALLATGIITLLAYTGVAPQTWISLPERFGRFALMAGLALVAWQMRARAPALRGLLPALLVVVAVIDLFAANRPLNVVAPYQAYPPDPVVAPIQADTGFFRVQDDARLPGHAGCAYGYREIDGVTPYQLAAYNRLLNLPEPVRWTLLGVRYVTTWRADLLDPDDQRIPAEIVAQSQAVDDQGNPTRTYRLAAEPRRAWLARAVSAEPDEDALYARLAEPGFDPLNVVLVAEPVPAASGAGAPASITALRVVFDEPGYIQLNAQSEAAAVLVASEAYFPGWRVTVDGQPALLLRADGALLGVALSAGEHAVEFQYQPDTLRWGGALSLLGLVTTTALLLVPVRMLKRLWIFDP